MRIIPEHAKKVFAGIMFDVWQWEQKLFDGSLTTFEAVSRENTVCVFATQGDQLIMTHQKQPQETERYRDFPGGRVPRDKDLLEHAQCELQEETGMVSNDRNLYRSYKVGGKVFQSITYYIARDVQKVTEQSLDPGGEMIQVKSLDFDTMIDMVITGVLGDIYFTNDILRMKIEGNLGNFRKKLFG